MSTLSFMSENNRKKIINEKASLLVLGENGEHPRLVFHKKDIPVLKAKLNSDVGEAIIRQLKKRLDVKPIAQTIGYHAAAHAFLGILYDDNNEIDIACELVEKTITDQLKVFVRSTARHPQSEEPLWNSSYKMIFRAAPLLGISLAYDLCYGLWKEGFSIRVAGELEKKCGEMLAGGGFGWNDSPWSNWQAITKGAAGVAALSVIGDPGTSPTLIHSLYAAKEGILRHFDEGMGDHGWTAEGFNYLRYELCHGILPFLQAYKSVMGEDIVAGTIAKWFMPFYVMQILKLEQLCVPFYGRHYPEHELWQRTMYRSGDLAMGLGTVLEKYKPALLWTFNHSFGMEGDQSFDIFNPHDAIFALSNYPIELTPINPETVLPRCWEDIKKGYYVFRKVWRDENDFITTINLNAMPHGRSHSFRDAGSFRIIGLGNQWAVQKYKDGHLRCSENVVQEPNTTGWHGARLTYRSFESDGSGTISMNMDDVYTGGDTFEEVIDIGIQAMRSFLVDYSGRSECPGLYGVLDRFHGGGRKSWVMHTTGKVSLCDRGFAIEGNNGAYMKGIFAVPRTIQLSIEDYGEGTTIQATGGDEFFVAMVVYKEGCPEMSVLETHLEVKIQIGSQVMSFDGEKLVLEHNY